MNDFWIPIASGLFCYCGIMGIYKNYYCLIVYNISLITCRPKIFSFNSVIDKNEIYNRLCIMYTEVTENSIQRNSEISVTNGRYFYYLGKKERLDIYLKLLLF